MSDRPRCGGPTLWGTPCTRKVKKKGDRCWKHAGQSEASSDLERSLLLLRRELALDLEAIDSVLRLLKRSTAQRVKDAGITANAVLGEANAIFDEANVILANAIFDELGGQATPHSEAPRTTGGPGNIPAGGVAGIPQRDP